MIPESDAVQIIQVKLGSRADKLGIEQGFRFTAIESLADRPAKEWMFVPALLQLLVALIQRARARRIEGQPPLAA